MSELLEAHRRINASFTELPDEHRCSFVSSLLSERCHYPGAVSHGTRGGGPWYCAGHFFTGDQGAEIVTLSRGYYPGRDITYPERLKREEEATEILPVEPAEVLVQEEPGSGG